MSHKQPGALFIIGGHEDKKDEKTILKEVVKHINAGTGKLVILTVATQDPAALAKSYRHVFHVLGVRQLEVLDVRIREDAQRQSNLEKLDGAQAVFFTGGDQLRITSQLGDTPLWTRLQELHAAGAAIVGTSAGAAAMPAAMMVGGAGDASPGSCELAMAPGLGLFHGVTIDSHFAQRGRIGRLLCAVAQNPMNLGLGIDEDTAIIVRGNRFRVVGHGSVYVVDGSGITYSSLCDDNSQTPTTICNLKLHVLGADQHFDLANRCPVGANAAHS